MMGRRILKIIGWVALGLLGFFVLLLGVLYFLLGTTAGTQFAIDKATSLLEGTVNLHVKLKEGSVLYGFEVSEPLEVTVPDTVSVTSDTFDIDYNLFSYLSRGALVITGLNTTNLKVALLDGESAPEPETVEEEDSGEPFRLSFPVKIVIERLLCDKFEYDMSVINVKTGPIDLTLDVDGPLAEITKGTIEDPLVWLKDDESADGTDPAEIAAAETAQQEPSEPVPEVLTFDGGNGAIETIGPVELPLDAMIRDLHIKHGRYYMSVFDTGYVDVDLAAFWHGTLLQVRELSARHELGDVSVKGSMDFVGYLNFDFTLSGQGAKTEKTLSEFEGALYGLTGSGTVKGNLTDLHPIISITSPSEIEADVRLNCLSSDLPAEIALKVASLSYPLHPELTQKSAPESVSDAAAVPESAETAPDAASSEAETAQTDNAAGSENAPDEPQTAENSEAGVTEPESAASNLLPPEDDQVIYVKDLDLAAAGSLTHGFETKLKTLLKGYGLADTAVNLDGRLGLSATNLKLLTIEGSYLGEAFSLELAGEGDYESNAAFDGTIKASAGNLGMLNELLKGPMSLDSALKLSFDLETNAVALDLDYLKSSLTLNGREAQLNASEIKGGFAEGINLNIGSLTFTQLENSVTVQGSLSDNSDLTGSFGLKSLDYLLPALEGNFIGDLSVKGDIMRPDVELSCNSRHLRYNDISLLGFVLNTRLDSHRERADITVYADSVRLSPELKPSRQCGLQLSGTLSDHELSFNCGGSNGGYFNTKGSYDPQSGVLSGTLRDLMFVNEYMAPISLRQGVEYSVNLNTIEGRVGEVILTGNDIGTLTVKSTEFAPGSVKTAADLTGYELEHLANFLPEGSKTQGTVSAHADVTVEDGDPVIDAEVTAGSSMLNVSGLLLRFDSAKATASYTKDGVRAGADVQLARKFGSLMADVTVSDPAGSKKLGGHVSLKDLNLALFTALGNSFNELTGTANIEGDFGGTTDKPLFNGTLAVNGAAETRYDIGRVETFDLKLDATGTQGTLTGKLNINEGDLKLGGHLNWADAPRGTVTVDSDDLPVFLMGYGNCHTTVHLTAAMDDILDLKGKITVPAASIEVKNIASSGLQPSSDEIIVGSGGTQALIRASKNVSPPMKSTIDVDVSLGDKVKLDAMGLKASVVGGVHVTKELDSDSVNADGEVSLEDGAADVFGHRFLVNEARVIFKGNITSPTLSAEIVADPETLDENVEVGVKASGAATDPTVELFSKPAMSENEILSYLLYGHGLEKADTDSEAASGELLLMMGLGTTTGIINSLTGAMGMSGVQVQSKGSGEDAQLGVQTNITKDIRISYGYGVFNSVGEFKLRYEIMRKLYLEFISSIDQMVDLVYSFEFD